MFPAIPSTEQQPRAFDDYEWAAVNCGELGNVGDFLQKQKTSVPTTSNGYELIGVQPVTKHLVAAIVLKFEPCPSVLAAFGIQTQQEYDAICPPVRSGQITPQQMDAILGSGKRLPELLRPG